MKYIKSTAIGYYSVRRQSARHTNRDTDDEKFDCSTRVCKLCLGERLIDSERLCLQTDHLSLCNKNHAIIIIIIITDDDDYNTKEAEFNITDSAF